jgi:hypothetical protein
MKQGQKMMTSATFIVVLWSSYEIMAKDNDDSASLSSSPFFSYIAKDYGSLSSRYFY